MRLASTLVFFLIAAPSLAETPPERQFDFWIGEWDVDLRIRQDDGSWPKSVRADAHIYPVLGGKAILELWDSDNIKGYSLRYYDPAKEKWVLWLNWPGPNRSGQSSLEGAFRHGRGEFFTTQELPDGKERISRYTFSDITPDSLRWDDGFSTDGGKTWAGNWIMEFTRRASVPSWPPAGRPAHTHAPSNRCDREEFRAVEVLDGVRTGTIERRLPDGSWSKAPALLRGHRVLGGCAVMVFLETSVGDQPHEECWHVTYNTYAEVFALGRLDARPGTPLRRYFGPRSNGTLSLVHRAADEARTPVQKVTLTPGSDGSLLLEQHDTRDGGQSWTLSARGMLHR
ncbi:MAG: hypothetical protein AAF533_07675 [Acidobacteriota bacterium]